MAGGTIYGVASRANLHLVKFMNAYTDKNGVLRNRASPNIALRAAMDNVLAHIKDNNNQGKAVINLSSGRLVPKPPQKKLQLLSKS